MLGAKQILNRVQMTVLPNDLPKSSVFQAKYLKINEVDGKTGQLIQISRQNQVL